MLCILFSKIPVTGFKSLDITMNSDPSLWAVFPALLIKTKYINTRQKSHISLHLSCKTHLLVVTFFYRANIIILVYDIEWTELLNKKSCPFFAKYLHLSQSHSLLGR